MKTVSKNIELIQRDKYYSLLKLYELKVFPWITSYDMLRRWVKRSMKKEVSSLPLIFTGEGRGRRYLVKGRNIQKILKALEENKTLSI